ncbi:MAG TPA: YraN family protein [Thermoanaerobaculia bacterium]|nr:YraN family protein [Thermoanaerobaculia bacterium]
MPVRARLFERIWPKRILGPAELGRAGEARAARFFRLRGWRIVQRNLRTRDGEIDLVLRRGSRVVFVEVKTRQQTGMGEPHEAVDRRKQLRIIRMAERYLHQEKLRDLRVSFDVVSLFWTGRRFRLIHFPDAFIPVSDPLFPWRDR